MRKILFALCLLLSAYAQAGTPHTQLTGTLAFPDNTGVTGILYLSLSQSAAITTLNSCGGPVQVVPNETIAITLTNGNMVSWTASGNPTVHAGAPLVYGSDCTIPSGVPYNALLRDSSGNIVFNTQWLIVGATQDIGTVFASPIAPQATYLTVITSNGAPSGVCGINTVYVQADAAVGSNLWFCVNGAFQQQTGANTNLTIGSGVTSGTAKSVLFLSGSATLAQDNANFFYDSASHTLTVTNFVTTSFTGNVIGNASTANVANALANTPTTCGTQAATGILPNGNPAGCVSTSAPAGATNEVQTKSPTGGLAGSGIFSNGVQANTTIPFLLASDPTTALQAATKQYVDNTLNGLVATGVFVTNPVSSQTVVMPSGTSTSFTNSTGGASVNIGAGVMLNIVGSEFIGGKLYVKKASITASATAGASGEIVDLVDTTTAAVTMTLPAANNGTTLGGQVFGIVKINSGANAVTIAAAGTDTINGSATYTLTGQWSSVVLASDDVSGWRVLSSNSLPITASQMPAFTGDVTTVAGNTVTTLATVNSAPGVCGDATHYCQFTVNAKGLITGQTAFLAPGAITFKTNGTVNTIQNVVDFNNGPGILITQDPITGKVTFTNTYAINPTPLGVQLGINWANTSTATLMDDEFTSNPFNTSNIWTIVNQNANVVKNQSSLLSIQCAASATDNWVGVFQLAPASVYQVAARIDVTGISAASYYGGLAVRDSGTGKAVTLQVNNGGTVTVVHWNSPTSSAATVATANVDGAPRYFSIKDDGTNLNFYVSKDGVYWLSIFSESRTAFLAAPGQIGIMAGSANASNPMALGADWFRRIL